MPNRRTGSVSSRIAVTLFVNIGRAILSMGTGLLIARGMSPDDYGRLSFMLGSFVAVRQLMEMGSSSAFYTFISKRERSKTFYLYYLIWLCIQLVIPLLFIGILFPSTVYETIWVGESRGLIVLSFLASFIQTQIWQVVIQIGESQRLTSRVQGLNISVAAIHICIISVLWITDRMIIEYVFSIIIIEYLVAVAFASKLIPLKTSVQINESTLKDVYYLFKEYCKPLVAYAWISFAYMFADRWFLQQYGGSSEQAYYSIGAKLSSVVLIATASILKIFWKEIARASEEGNLRRMEALYNRVNQLLFIGAASISGLLLPWGGEIIEMVLGSDYLGGSLTFSIMLLYPVHQSMGQITGTMFYATEQTKSQVAIGITSMLCSIVVSYIFLAPTSNVVPGLDLGSSGLAAKMVLIQLITVNVSSWWIARHNGWHYKWIFQIVSIGVALTIGWICYIIVHSGLFISYSVFATFVIAGILFVVLLVVSILVVPSLAGMSRSQIQALIARIQNIVNS